MMPLNIDHKWPLQSIKHSTMPWRPWLTLSCKKWRFMFSNHYRYFTYFLIPCSNICKLRIGNWLLLKVTVSRNAIFWKLECAKLLSFTLMEDRRNIVQLKWPIWSFSMLSSSLLTSQWRSLNFLPETNSIFLILKLLWQYFTSLKVSWQQIDANFC